jgi:hypothetical protein
MSSQDLPNAYENKRPDVEQSSQLEADSRNKLIAADQFDAQYRQDLDEQSDLEEAGDIGEEQLPSAMEAGSKTDKQVWSYAADKPAYGSRLGQLFREWFKGQ